MCYSHSNLTKKSLSQTGVPACLRSLSHKLILNLKATYTNLQCSSVPLIKSINICSILQQKQHFAQVSHGRGFAELVSYRHVSHSCKKYKEIEATVFDSLIIQDETQTKFIPFSLSPTLQSSITIDGLVPGPIKSLSQGEKNSSMFDMHTTLLHFVLTNDLQKIQAVFAVLPHWFQMN